MTTSDWITLLSSIASLVLAGISFWALWETLKQNKAMLENSTRPYIVPMYEAMTLPDCGAVRYIIIKNCGQSCGTITDINISGSCSEEFRHQLFCIKGATMAPGQKFPYYFGPANEGEPEVIEITLKYSSSTGHVYNETTSLHMIVGGLRRRTKKDEAIPMILQDISERLL